MSVNLEYYRIFYYVAKNKSITAAAGDLCISQPAVSQAVKTLETSLGSKLFVRMAKGVSLTKEGEALYTHVKQGYEQILLGEEAVMRMHNLELGEIRIGASDMTLQFYLLPFLEQFHEKYPKIKVTVTNAPTPETISYLKEGKIDFGVVSEPFWQEGSFFVTRVLPIQDVFVAGNRFCEYKDRIVTFEELKDLPVICLEGNTSSRTFVDSFLKDESIVLTPEFELATSNMIVQFASRNLGVGMVVKSFAEPYLKRGELFELKLSKAIPKRNFCLLEDKRFPLSQAAKKLMEMMTDPHGCAL